MGKREKFKRLHSVIVEARELLDDKTASIAPELFGTMTYFDREPEDEIPLIKVGTRINWKGTLKRAAVDLWDIETNNPDNAPTLWEDINYRDGYRIIPSPITVGLAFSKGEYGWWGDTLYCSKVDNNVYTPDEYMANWELVE